MKAIRIRKTLDSETLYLPELKPMIGKVVEIIVLEQTGATPVGAEKGNLEFFFALAPSRDRSNKQQLDQFRELAKADASLAPILDVAENDLIDVDAVATARLASMT